MKVRLPTPGRHVHLHVGDAAEQRLDDVEAVNAEVPERVAAFPERYGQGPARVGRHGLTPVKIDAQYFTDGTALHQGQGARDEGIAQERVTHTDDPSRRPGGRLDAIARLHARRQRLLDVDVAPALERGNRCLGVTFGWRQDVDDVEALIKQLGERAMDAGDLEAGGEGPGAPGIGLRDADNRRARHALDGEGVKRADGAGANEPDAKGRGR